MKQILKDRKMQIVVGMILLAAISRIVPHPFNFTPIGAMALFGGATINNRKYAFLFPLAALFISDCMLQLINGTGFHIYMPFVYGSFVLITCIGFFIRKLQNGYSNVVSIMVAPMFSSILFFIITNFGVWLNGGYSYTAAGLGACYIAAIPFFYGTVLGDIFYCAVLFGSYAFIKWRNPAIA